MSSEEAHFIEGVFQRFDRMAVADIRAAFEGGAKAGAFILTFVAIDCLSTWYAGSDSTSKAFAKFIEDFFPLQYKEIAADFYRFLRCGLVHNYSTKTNKYALKDGEPSVHLETTPDGTTTIVNWEDLFRDFLTAKERFYHEVRQSKELQGNLRKRVEKPGVLKVRQICLAWLDGAYSCTIDVSTI